MSTLHEERIIRQDIDFSSSMAPGQDTGRSDLKNGTPSLVSSGYESQALATTTISSNEDSLSLRSISVDECESEDKEENNTASKKTEANDILSSRCSSGTEEEKEKSPTAAFPDWLVEGESVQVKPSNFTGVVRFLGTTSFAAGAWVGVELDTPQGKNDGSVDGVRYFNCGAKRGMFVRPKNLRHDRRGRDLRTMKKSQ